MACLYGCIAVLAPAQVRNCTWEVLCSSAPSIQNPKTHFCKEDMTLKRQLTAIYTHSCTKVYTSVRKILFFSVLKSFLNAKIILSGNYRQIFSLAYRFVRDGLKIFDSYLVKIIFNLFMKSLKSIANGACLYGPIAGFAPAQVRNYASCQ